MEKQSRIWREIQIKEITAPKCDEKQRKMSIRSKVVRFENGSYVDQDDEKELFNET